MKLIILLSIVAFCSAYPYQSFGGYGYGSQFGNVHDYGHDVEITRDGSVTITTPYGNEIIVTSGMGLNAIVTVIAPSVSHGYLNFFKSQPAGVGILEQIISQYQGELSPSTYQLLLRDVYAAVQKGLLDDDVYWAFYNFYQQHYLQGGMDNVISPYEFPTSGVHGFSPLAGGYDSGKYWYNQLGGYKSGDYWYNQLGGYKSGNYWYNQLGGYKPGNYWYNQPSAYPHTGLYGLYGQGNQYNNVPMVY